MSAKFPGVSKRLIVPGIIDLPKFNYEDLEEIVTVRSPFDGPLLQSDRVHLDFMGNASRYIIT